RRNQPDYWTYAGMVLELKTRWELNQREVVLEKLDLFRSQQPGIESIPGLWVLRGVIARQMQEADMSMDCFQQARDLAQRADLPQRNRMLAIPDLTWKPLLGLAEVQLGEGLFSQAYLQFKQVNEYLPGNDYVLSGLLKSSFFIRRYDTIADILGQGSALRGISAIARSMLEAIIALNAGTPPEGLEELVNSLSADVSVMTSDPFLVSVMLEFAIAMLHHARHTLARTLLMELARLIPDQPVIWHNLAYSHFAEGEYELAEQYYRKVLTLEPRFHESRYDLAKVLVMQHRQEEALAEFYELRQLQPHDMRVKQAIRQLEPSEVEAFAPPLIRQQPQAEPMPFIFVFPLQPSWENGADIALKAYYQEFVGDDQVILAFAGAEESELQASARAWAEAKFLPELLPPVALLDEALPLLQGQSAWVLPWRLNPGEALLQKLSDSGYTAIVTGMRLPSGQPLPATMMAEAEGDQRRIWVEADVEAIANQMRLAVNGDLQPTAEAQNVLTHDLLADAAAAEVSSIRYQAPPEAPAPGISVCMIVKDEAEMLPKCLDSIHDQVDEIILVDTGSQDSTREIAASYPKVRLFEIEWTGDFAAARNYSLEQASEPWILALDADEYVAPDFVASLAPSLSADEQPDAYAFPVLAVDAGGEIDQAQSLLCVPRLFHNDKAYRYSGRIHEMVKHEERSRLHYYYMKQLPIYHRGYQPQVLEAKQKRLRDTALMEAMIEQEPAARETQRLYVILAGQYELDGDPERALACFESGLEVVHDDALIRSMLLRGRLRLLHSLGRDQQVLEASAGTSEDPYVTASRAQALRRLGRLQEALDTAEQALHLAERQALQPDPLEQQLQRGELLRDLAQLNEELGDLNQALYYFKRYLKLAPSKENWKIYENLQQKLRV
ncbi:MAG: glycosyltransferase, partial [Candidatus Sericytochromatia bacterium]